MELPLAATLESLKAAILAALQADEASPLPFPFCVRKRAINCGSLVRGAVRWKKVPRAA